MQVRRPKIIVILTYDQTTADTFTHNAVFVLLDISITRVFFYWSYPEKYGTGPPQYRKITLFTGDGKNPLLKK